MMEKLRANGGDGRNEELCLSCPQPQLMGSGWWKPKFIKFAPNFQISPNIQFGKFDIVAHRGFGPNEAY